MDLNFIGNALLFSFAIAWQFGWLDGSSSANADTGEEDEPLYDPAAYSGEFFGTDGDDDVDADVEGANLAYFLGLGDDTLNGSSANDYAEGGAGNDDFMMRPGDDIALGGDGDDVLDGGFGDDLLFGGAGNDTVNGSKDNDTLFGEAGNDILTGSVGDDTLDGGTGDDTLSGHILGDPGTAADGTDTLDGGAGNDTLQMSGADTGTGGDGSDVFEIHDTGDTENQVTVTDFDPDVDQIAIHYTPTLDPGTGDPISPTVSLTPNAEGTASTLFLDGLAVANITGGQSLVPDDIVLVAKS